MVGMSILSEAGGFGLLRREQALLLLGYFEEPTRRISTRLNHMHNTTTLLLFCAQSQELASVTNGRRLGNTGSPVPVQFSVALGERLGGPTRTRTWNQSIMSALL